MTSLPISPLVMPSSLRSQQNGPGLTIGASDSFNGIIMYEAA